MDQLVEQLPPSKARRDAAWDLPRLGGRRPLYADLMVWGGVIAFLPITFADASWFRDEPTRFAFVIAAGVVLTWWALWRFGKFSARIADVAFRREIALSGVSASAFLTRQLFRDSVAAFGPSILAICLAPPYIAGLLVSSTFVAAAGASWIFRQRCSGAGYVAITASTGATLTLASAGVLAVEHRYPYYGYGWLQKDSPLAMTLIIAGLFLSSAQIGASSVRRPLPTRRIREYVRLLLFVAVGTCSALAAGIVFARYANDFLNRWEPYNIQPVLVMMDPFVFVLAVCLIAAAAAVLLRYLGRYEARLLWPANVIGSIAIAAGVSTFLKPTSDLDSILTSLPAHVLCALLVATPVAGLAMLTARHCASAGMRDAMAALALFVSTAVGVIVGVKIMGSIDAPMALPTAAFTMVVMTCFAVKRSGDPPLIVWPLVFSALLLGALREAVLIVALAAAVFAWIQWKRAERNYFGKL